MKTLLAPLLTAFLVTIAAPEDVAAQLLEGAVAPNEMPFTFADMRYGASIDEAVKRFGKPARTDSINELEEFFWASDQLKVTFQKRSRLISSFTVTGSAGVNAVRHVHDEPLLKLLTLSQDEVVKQLGKPNKIWYDNRRMSWDFKVNRRVDASLFFECLNGPTKPCAQLSVYWSGAAIRDPNDDDVALGPDGIFKYPTCDYDFRIKKSLEVFLKELPTGIKASTDKWDMEIYADSKGGSWTLVGKSKDPGARSTHVCKLARSIDVPYANEKWFRTYFKQ